MTDSTLLSANAHPRPEEIAAYLSNALRPDEREVLEAHLSRCRVCRRQVTSAHALLRARPRPIRWIVAAAAAVLAITVVRPWSSRDADRITTSSDVERAKAATITSDLAITALTPADGDTIPGTAALFTWRSRGRDVLYHLSVTDASGRAIWKAETRDTTVALPPDVHLESGTRYFWYVDALGTNAVSWTTGTHAFVVTP